MRLLLPILSCLLLGSAAWGAEETRLDKLPEPITVGQELLQTTNSLWFLLSAVRNKEEANAAVDRFNELMRKANRLDAEWSSSEIDVSDEKLMAMVEMMRTRLMESYDTLHNEVNSLCSVRCYGSVPLLKSFRQVVDEGLFDVTSLPDCLEDDTPLSASEERSELVRLKRLVEPDRAVLDALSRVKDPGSARKAASQLARIAERLKNLPPTRGVARRSYNELEDSPMREAGQPLQKILWGIRNEIVRIAGLPDYEAEAYDDFSETLNDVYESLGDTHSAWFDDVFDASFHSDLDDAIQENKPSPTKK